MRQDLVDRIHRILFDVAVMNSAHPIKARVYYPRVNIALRWISVGLMGSAFLLSSRFAMPLLYLHVFALPLFQWFIPSQSLPYKMSKITFYASLAGMASFSVYVVLKIALGIQHPVNQTLQPWMIVIISTAMFIFICGRAIEDVKLWKNAANMDSKTGTTDSV